MKIIFATLALASFAWAKPVSVEGRFYQKTEVIPQTKVTQQIVFDRKVVGELINQGYGCRRVESKFLCTKSEGTFELPALIQDKLRLKSPSFVEFEPSNSSYFLSHDSDVYNQWTRNQTTSVDTKTYTEVNWRETVGVVEKVILKNITESVEFVWMGNDEIGFVTSFSETDQKTQTTIKYWGLVLYTH